MSLIKVNDGISPDLLKRAAAVQDKRPLLEAMGQAVKSLGVQAFTDASKRPSYWAPRKDNLPHALLLKTPLLVRTIKVLGVSGSSVTIGSDRPYAATHQLGRGPIPARPYLPFYQSGQMTALGRQRTDRALVAALRVRGL
jgi:phage gpG-like protein